MKTLLLVAVVLVVSMGAAYAEEKSTDAVAKVREAHPPTAGNKVAKNPKVRSAAARAPTVNSMNPKSSGGGGESAVAKAWREADI